LGCCYRHAVGFREKLLLEAVEESPRPKFGANNPHTQQSLSNLIALYESWGKPEKAAEWRAKLPQLKTARK